MTWERLKIVDRDHPWLILGLSQQGDRGQPLNKPGNICTVIVMVRGCLWSTGTSAYTAYTNVEGSLEFRSQTSDNVKSRAEK